MDFLIEPAALVQSKAKIALIGPSGAGKTYTALSLARELGNTTLIIDTENKSSAKYSDLFTFDVMALPEYSLKTYIGALEYAAAQSYEVVIIDSLSHAWAGKGGALEHAEQAGRSKYGGNTFAGWADVTPLQNQLIDTILSYPCHLIATMRMKIEYALVESSKGKKVPQKMGLGIVQRDSFEYEFDIIGQMDVDHNLAVTKTRCSELDGYLVNKPGQDLGQRIKAWLQSGEAPPPIFNSIDDVYHQLNMDFGWKESHSKDVIKTLGFATLPRGKKELQNRLQLIYKAVKEDNNE